MSNSQRGIEEVGERIYRRRAGFGRNPGNWAWGEQPQDCRCMVTRQSDGELFQLWWYTTDRWENSQRFFFWQHLNGMKYNYKNEKRREKV